MPFSSIFSGKSVGDVADAPTTEIVSTLQEPPTVMRTEAKDDRRKQADASASTVRDHKAISSRSSKTVQVVSQAVGATRVTRIKVSIRQHGSEHSSLWRSAVPGQSWFRALLALFHLLMGSTAIQVGLREENVVCEASFSTLMIIAGFLQLLQAALGMYLVFHSIGFEGEELRLCLWMIELVAWTLVAHALLTDICGNRKIHATSVLYLCSSLLVWVLTFALWLSAYYRTEDEEKRVEINYVR